VTHKYCRRSEIGHPVRILEKNTQIQQIGDKAKKHLPEVIMIETDDMLVFPLT
jgi:hypothetical protein